MHERIYGIETEFGFSLQGPSHFAADHGIRLLLAPLIPDDRFLNTFLENGGRLYQDTGLHPEWATPECRTLLQAVTYDRAGMGILEDLQKIAQAELVRKKKETKIFILKNNTDAHGSSYGCHENYMAARSASFEYLSQHIIPFLVTRHIFCGAGKIMKRGGTPYYSISQRAKQITTRISGTTTNDRSVLNTRDEPHADREFFRRLHIILGDSNMSDFTNWLKLGTCSIVIQMIEDRFFDGGIQLKHPIDVLHESSEDPTCKNTNVYLADQAKPITPLDVQRYYCEKAKSYISQYRVSEELKEVVKEWEFVLNALDTDRSKLDTKIDWVIKEKIINNYMERNKVDLTNARAAMIDYQYHDILQERGLFLRLEAKGMVERMTDPSEVEKAKTEPPQDTRAKMRSEFIRLAKELGLMYELDWASMRLGSLLNVRVMCLNPFEHETDKVVRMMDTLKHSKVRRATLAKYIVRT